ncbi:hypothetical protein FPB06_09000, partial [Enterobacter hormaechei]|uniref:hypothetical protein n=1 Tax=Enterobacter hormaechei TaxID=158836 RepID=UPI00119084A3
YDKMCIHLNLMIFTKIIRGFISTELHQVLYASDYVLERNANNKSKLTPIPTSEIVAATIRALN